MSTTTSPGWIYVNDHPDVVWHMLTPESPARDGMGGRALCGALPEGWGWPRALGFEPTSGKICSTCRERAA